MNKTNLKRYAPQARKDFISAVTARAQLLGLSEVAGQPHAEPCQVNGDVAVIAGRPWPANVQGKRERLLQRMNRDGYAATLEAVAYTWFNRFAALRYMELHDYLGHGRRVLSNPDGALPEVLSHVVELAEAGVLPGLQVEQVRQLKLDNQDGELFRRVLIAQCNALHGAMPFLFEAIDDETELLLPDNLLLSDSVVVKLVSEIPEEDWAEVEAIGWLYQFYISEKKDQVIGKVVKSEDIPAATQLFTPNWIVQYLVQNSVGRLWLMANPDSALASQWSYYIQPAEQTPEVQAQLDALIQTRIGEDGEALNPETITVLDPACGSGHILVVAYDVLKAIYQERGYQPRAIPRLILEKNLYGLDIDDRAAQLAGFALLMKARADDRRLFNGPPQLNVLSLQECKGLNAEELASHLVPFGLRYAAIKELLDTFDHAKNFGSLLQIPANITRQLLAMTEGMQQALRNGDLYARRAAMDLLPMVRQASVLSRQFDAVVANPPYMGAKYYNAPLKLLVEDKYRFAKGDLYTCFLAQNTRLSKSSGIVAMITIPNWMFLSSFEDLRNHLFESASIETFSHNGRGVFGSDFGSCAFTYRKTAIADFKGRYKRLFDKPGSVASNNELHNRFLEAVPYEASISDFRKIPGSPLAYWVSNQLRSIFSTADPLGLGADVKQGLATADNDRFLRLWSEVSIARTGFNFSSRDEAKGSGLRWFPHSKGGEFRKWYGNREWVLNWQNDGEELFAFRPRSVIRSPSLYFKPCISWTLISSATTAFRLEPVGNIIGHKGPGIFAPLDRLQYLLALLNSCVSEVLLKILSPSIGFEVGQISQIPVIDVDGVSLEPIQIAKLDWDSFETSWDFVCFPWLPVDKSDSLEKSWLGWSNACAARIRDAKLLEEKNNAIFIEAYGLHGELSSDVLEEQITLTRADREKDCQRLISYIIGCMMGRYSLGEPGLIYAHAGNVGFDPSRYEKKFPADVDGIVPITYEIWAEDDAAGRVRAFLLAVWGVEKLEVNMAWLAESLGIKGGETSEETIRRYLAERFFKDHLQTYKKRPIYWLFSSGKQGAFQALVYLHRYHEGTLARMRSEYVLPLTGKMLARMESLEVDIRQASSTAARNKLTKQLEALRKQHHELLAYDEKLRHYADKRIAIDLDDGVKVNYGKFGDLLAEVKTVTGGTADE